MKRIILMLTVAAMMAAMVALSVGVASAAVDVCPEPGPGEVSCMGQGDNQEPGTLLPGQLPSEVENWIPCIEGVTSSGCHSIDPPDLPTE